MKTRDLIVMVAKRPDASGVPGDEAVPRICMRCQEEKEAPVLLGIFDDGEPAGPPLFICAKCLSVKVETFVKLERSLSALLAAEEARLAAEKAGT